MSDHTKHEVWLLAIGTLAAAPVLTGVGLVAISGLIAW